MLVIVGTVRLPRDKLTNARGAMERMIRGSRAEVGCLAYSYAEDMLEPGLVRVTEIWRDQTALEAHLASDHLAAWRATWPDLGLVDRDLWLYESKEPRRV